VLLHAVPRPRAQASGGPTQGREEEESPMNLVYEVVPLPVAGSHKKRFNTYGDAQRYAWQCLRRNDRFDLAKIKILGLDGKWREMENWTIGVSGKFKHAYPVEHSKSRRGPAKTRRDPPLVGARPRHPRKSSKYVTIFVVQGNYGYGHGWEDLTTEMTGKEGRARLREYRANESAPFRLIQRRVLREDPTGGFRRSPARRRVSKKRSRSP
jgi:hypothetical protein